MSTPSTSAPPSGSPSSPPPSREQRIARARAILQATVLENRWVPDSVKAGLTVKQAEFLCYEGREALYGGAAGGGKSVALLLAALQYVDESGYTALILRRTYKQLAKADSILNKSKEWLWGKARWNGDTYTWTFPNGATLEFGHMENEDAKLNYQGGAWAFVGVDEATQFTEPMLTYPRTRQRRPAGSPIPIRWRGASNPGGVGHEYIKARYVKDRDGKDPSTPDRQFFPATIDDNPNLDREEYVTQLREAGVDPLTLAQLLAGDWDAVAGGRFRRDWFRYYDRRGDYYLLDGKPLHPSELRLVFLTADTAASVKTSADYTVISAWGITKDHRLLWLDCHRGRWEVPDILPEIQAQYTKHNAAFVGIEAVAGHSGTGVYQLAKRTKMIVRALSPKSTDKLVRATPAIVLAESGRLWLPAAKPRWVEDAEAELVRFTGDDKKDANDDIVDTLSYAVQVLTGNEDANQQSFPPYVAGR